MTAAALATLLAVLLAAESSAPVAALVLPPLTEADLAPLFAEGAEAQAKAAFDSGRFDEAAARLARSKSPEARYLRALALLELKRHTDALRALDGLESRLPDLADRVLFLRGEALAALGRREAAIGAWTAVASSSLLAPEARLGRARLAAALGDRGAALDALAPLLSAGAPADLSRPDLVATALLLSGRLKATGAPRDAAGARRDLIACWAGHPLAPEAAECLASLRAMPGEAGAAPTPEETLTRAEGLLDANRNRPAIALLEPMAASVRGAARGDAFACRILAALGRGYRKERSYARAIETLRRVVEGCEDPGLRVRALYLLASAVSIAGDREEGITLYRRLAREFRDHSFADDALLYVADLLVRAGREAEAREALAELVRDHPRGDYRDEARFRLAWLARRAGEADAALAQLLAIEEEASGGDAYEHARAAYWRARVLDSRGEEGARAARAIWADLAGRYATDYYGLLARVRLADGGEVLPLPVVPAGEPAKLRSYDPGPLREDPHFRAGLLLARMGLSRPAAAELGAIAPARLSAAATASDPAVLLADLLDRSGDHRAAHNLLRTRARAALRRPPDDLNARAWRIAFPLAFRADVERWAPAAGVPMDLLQALMREESALDPGAVSPAGAIGLTQLMLPTAQSVAKRLRLGRPSRGDLMHAPLNIRIGARYLGELIRRFEGQVPLALAAYNAGGGAVGRWLEARRDLALDEFVEEIPIEETRGYVKRVLRSYAAYRMLYGSGEASGVPELLRVANN
jgi:soluble lytic murein transglycosylase